jgi:hypothetical protein
MSEKEISDDINCHPVHKVLNVKSLARLWELLKHNLSPLLKNVQIADPVLDKHRSDEVTAILPELMVGGKDGVTQEWRPDTVELLALSIVGKLSSKYGLDVFWFLGNQEALPSSDVDLASIWLPGVLDVGKCMFKEVEELIF